MNLRLFIAIDIPEEIKRQLGDLIDILQKHDANVTWVVRDNLHLTLKFLGATPETLLSAIRDRLARVFSLCAPFLIRVRSAGAFPNERHPRVLWVGIENSDHLEKLRNDIEDALFSIGIQRDTKSFHPHLTLGRVRNQRGMLMLLKDFLSARNKHFGDVLVDRIHLMKSDLKPGGPLYTCLHSFPLGGAATA